MADSVMILEDVIIITVLIQNFGFLFQQPIPNNGLINSYEIPFINYIDILYQQKQGGNVKRENVFNPEQPMKLNKRN